MPLDINITQVGNRKFNNEWFVRNQWLTASIAKQSLACYSVEWVCGPKSGFNGVFSKLKKDKHSTLVMLSIQHDFCRVQNTWNLRTGKSDIREFKTTGNWEKKQACWTIIQLGSQELRPLSRAPTWQSLTSSWFNLVFFRVPSCFKAQYIKRMPDFDDKICPRRTAAPPSCSSEHSTTRWVQKSIVCCCINDVIYQGDMYTVAKKQVYVV